MPNSGAAISRSVLDALTAATEETLESARAYCGAVVMISAAAVVEGVVVQSEGEAVSSEEEVGLMGVVVEERAGRRARRPGSAGEAEGSGWEWERDG